MFEKLVESETNGTAGNRRKNLLISASVLVTGSMSTALLFSLFNQTFAMGEEIAEISTLISPPAISTFDPESEPERGASSSRSAIKEVRAVPVVRDHVQNIEEPPVTAPESVSAAPSLIAARPLGLYKIGEPNGQQAGLPSRGGTPGSTTGPGFGPDPESIRDGTPDNERQAVLSVNPPPDLKKDDPPSFIGIINGKAVHLEKPAYPELARRLGLKGTVKVQVLIDENGSVVSAEALSGHPVLRNACVDPARSSRFSPTYLNNKKVSVRGIILYNFN